jgi:hypothetical protein
MKQIKSESEILKIFKKSSLFSNKWSSYFSVYDKIFKPYKNKIITFVEIGVLNGGSLLMWKKYFSKNSTIIGIDLNPEAKKLEKYGFKIFIGNQTEKLFWKDFYKKIGKVDILLDDGGHKNLHQISTVHYSLSNIKNGGLIVVEDTSASYMREFSNPSEYSFINYCKNIIESIHRRSPLLKKNLNKYSKKVFSIDFYESIVVFNINKNKCKKSKFITNFINTNNLNDFRHDAYFQNTKKFINKKLEFINKIKFLRKIIRKLLYKNFLIEFYENARIKKILKDIKR